MKIKRKVGLNDSIELVGFNNHDKINALLALKQWAVSRQFYELGIDARQLERSLLEVTLNHINVYREIHDLSDEQKQFLLESGLISTKYLKNDVLRDLKITLIQS